MPSIKAWVVINNRIDRFTEEKLWKTGICDYGYTSLREGPTAKLTALQYLLARHVLLPWSPHKMPSRDNQVQSNL